MSASNNYCRALRCSPKNGEYGERNKHLRTSAASSSNLIFISNWRLVYFDHKDRAFLRWLLVIFIEWKTGESLQVLLRSAITTVISLTAHVLKIKIK
jgi:hypothetical protein